MICRFYTKCPGCDSNILLRISVGRDLEQPFYYVCKKCNSATRGKLQIWYKPKPDAKLELEEGEIYQEVLKHDQAINIHPDLPAIPDAAEMLEPGGSPFLTLMQLLGDKGEEFYKRLDRFRGCVDSDWIAVKRLMGYYLDSNWEIFDRQANKIMPDTLPEDPSQLQRHDILHRMMDFMTVPLWIELDYPEMKTDWNMTYNQAIKSAPEALKAYLTIGGLDDELIDLQRDLFHCFELYIDARSSYLPGLPVEMLLKGGNVIDDFRLFRDEFPLLRDIYISIFEACHKTLKYIVALLNILNRGGHNKFPDGFPKNLNKFSKLVNAKKYEYIKELKIWHDRWNRILNRNLRNSIGHLSVRHDLPSGNLILKDGKIVPYLRFVVQCLNMVHPLLLCCNAIKTYRIGLSLKQ